MFCMLPHSFLHKTFADIFCTNILWTSTVLKQLIGCCHCFEQTNIVTVFILVALETVDILMVDHSHAKGTMLETFLTKEGNKGTSLIEAFDCT